MIMKNLSTYQDISSRYRHLLIDRVETLWYVRILLPDELPFIRNVDLLRYFVASNSSTYNKNSKQNVKWEKNFLIIYFYQENEYECWKRTDGRLWFREVCKPIPSARQSLVESVHQFLKGSRRPLSEDCKN